MKNTFNIYIDESCHLEHDFSEVMCIGYIKIKQNDYEVLKNVIKAIKLKHKNPMEVKWNTISMSRWYLYKELIDFFFRSDIEFRSVLIKNKKNLGADRFNREDKNSYYYKTLKQLLNNKVSDENDLYRVYLDVKDTRGRSRLKLLETELAELHKEKSPFIYFQHLHSNENEFLQLTDLFIGAICYKARNESNQINSSQIKQKVIHYLEECSGYQLNDGTEPWETKFFIHDFQIKPLKND